jgi:hypothetical protein
VNQSLSQNERPVLAPSLAVVASRAAYTCSVHLRQRPARFALASVAFAESSRSWRYARFRRRSPAPATPTRPVAISDSDAGSGVVVIVAEGVIVFVRSARETPVLTS